VNFSFLRIIHYKQKFIEILFIINANFAYQKIACSLKYNYAPTHTYFLPLGYTGRHVLSQVRTDSYHFPFTNKFLSTGDGFPRSPGECDIIRTGGKATVY
jgi:hypothetical protein